MKQLGLAGGLAAMLALGGCAETNKLLGDSGQTWTMHPEKTAFSANAKVQVETGKKANRDVKVEAERLVPPGSMFQGTSTYVVWLKPPEGKPLNIGVLKPDKDLKAELETSTPYTQFQIMVTAEDSPQTTQPTMGNEVLSTDVTVAT